MKFLFSSLLIIFSCHFAFSQSHTYEAKIEGIKKDSLYKLLLTPDHKQYMSSDFHDVRIYNNKQQEIPYVILSEPPLKSKSDFIDYTIISQKHLKTYSEIIIHNPDKNKINNIAFNINNSDAYKYCSIEGSNDLKQWYSVSALQELSLLYNDAYTNSYKCVYFPLNDYTYFRLLVDDWQSEPLKINSAGYFKNSVIAGKLNEVPHQQTILEDSKSKTTTIHLSFVGNQSIDRLDFKIKSPRLYKRNATIYVNRKQTQKHKTEIHKETLFDFELNSDGSLLFDLPQINEPDFFIEISNHDNLPLEIETITCKQLATYLVSDFKAGSEYLFTCGDNQLKRPEYDLANFVSQTPQLFPEAKLDSIKPVNPSINPTLDTKEKSFFETQQFLWLCLGVGAIIVILFSRSLLKNMKEK